MTLRVVGIGASAGGLEPLRVLLGTLPADYRAAVIVAQHLSPSHASLLVDLLRRSAALPVVEIADGMALEAGHIYVTPPNNDVEVRDGRLVLSAPVIGPGPKPRINRLFQSMANGCGEQAVGVVLSGTGTDGALGLEALRSVGALALVQSPDSCQHDGMPRAALDLSAADGQMPPAELGAYLAELSDRRVSLEALETGSTLDRLIGLASRASGVDLGRYRQKSLLRRIGRRMALLRQTSLEAYTDWCGSHPDELAMLVNDFFINVTQFFRDHEAFATLYAVLRERLRKSTERGEFRVWTAGCSTGEEAYSLAILLQELSEEIGRPLSYRIFATDISERAITRARLGLYSAEAADDLGAQRAQRFLTATTEGFQISRALRDRVVFSVNDIARDAPFSRIDLVCCRNLLIYFTPEHQRQVLQTLHYALKPEGLLFLGSAESTSAVSELFSTASDTAHLYTKEGESRPPATLRMARAPGVAASPPPRNRGVEGETTELRLLRDLAREHAPATVVVNEGNELMFSRGDLTAWLGLPLGTGTLDLCAMLIEPLRSPVRAAMFQRRRQQDWDTPVHLSIAIGNQNLVEIQVQRFDPARTDWLRIGFRARPNPLPTAEAGLAPVDEAEARLFQLLESELFSTRASLQSVVQELETANEDMQTANEELQSTNEEFQSTNEELQTTNEELRSTNEELLTVNDELIQKTLELERAHADIAVVLSALPTPLVLVNNELRVRLFSTSFDELVPIVSIRPEDGLMALPWKVEIPSLREKVLRVLREQVTVRGAFRHGSESWKYEFNPVYDRDQSARSALLLFINTTELEEAQESLSLQRGEMERSLASVSDAILHFADHGPLRAANRVALALFGVEHAQQIPLDDGSLRRDADGKPGEVVTLSALRSEVRDIYDPVHTTLYLQRADDPQPRPLSVTLQALGRGIDGGSVLICMRDIDTSRREHELLVWASSHDELTGLLNRRAFDEALRKAAARATDGLAQTLLYIDLDQFKACNDLGGHAAGDEVLRQVTALIRTEIGAGGTVGRLGGDEFCVILDRTAIDSGLLIAEKLRVLIELLRVTWHQHTLRVGVSIGVAALGRDDERGHQALEQADAACIQAKALGRNRVESVTGDAISSLSGRLAEAQVVHQLKAAIDAGTGLFHVLEWILPLGDGGPRRLEVLTRLLDADGAPVPTQHLIASAERSGLIRQIDERAFREAQRLLALLPADAVERIHVNLSPHSLATPSFSQWLEAELASAPNLARRICFEITETAAFANLSSVRHFSAAVRPLGAQICLDDFGTGSSVLGQIRELSLDGLKIDGAFVRSMRTSEVDRIIVRSIQQIAQTLGLFTVAEYVADEGVAAVLKELQIEFGQGDWAGRELDEAQVTGQPDAR